MTFLQKILNTSEQAQKNKDYEYWRLKWMAMNQKNGGELFKKKADIEAWLEHYKITNYQLEKSEEHGYIVNVDGTVNLKGKKLFAIGVKFGKINGEFNCQDNNLKSLNFAPHTVKEKFDISNNLITSLVGSPKTVGSLHASHNKLTTLEGCPQEIAWAIFVSNNKLKSLTGSPEVVHNVFYCSHNELSDLVGAPKIIKGAFSAQNNRLESLKGMPEQIKGSSNFLFNPLQAIDYFPKETGEYFLIKVFLPGTKKLVRLEKSKEAFKAYEGHKIEKEKEILDSELEMVLEVVAQAQLKETLKAKRYGNAPNSSGKKIIDKNKI